ncbi:nitrate- and nitrite sensing domain-containing protein, partial [Kitasatospora nipponensis]|uniref:nitrate- and nitrite sensing domain-containing protein n=1 Tax=Kitasatospora nipponensis TaxID=258049 RepID=UPI0031DB555B
GSSSVTSKGRAIYAISLAKASASTQRVLMFNLLVGISQKRTTPQEELELVQQLAVASKLEQVSVNEFNTGSPAEDVRVYAEALVTQAATAQRAALKVPGTDNAPTMQGLIALGLSFVGTARNNPAEEAKAFQAARDAGLTPEAWNQATASHINALRTTETHLLEQVVGEAANIKNP